MLTFSFGVESAQYPFGICHDNAYTALIDDQLEQGL